VPWQGRDADASAHLKEDYPPPLALNSGFHKPVLVLQLTT
jgi:hypothetical protein